MERMRQLGNELAIGQRYYFSPQKISSQKIKLKKARWAFFSFIFCDL
jgi:hypothetical protein